MAIQTLHCYLKQVNSRYNCNPVKKQSEEASKHLSSEGQVISPVLLGGAGGPLCLRGRADTRLKQNMSIMHHTNMVVHIRFRFWSLYLQVLQFSKEALKNTRKLILRHE